MDIDALKYPIGAYTEPISITADEVEKSIGVIASFSLSLQTAIR